MQIESVMEMGITNRGFVGFVRSEFSPKQAFVGLKRADSRSLDAKQGKQCIF